MRQLQVSAIRRALADDDIIEKEASKFGFPRDLCTNWPTVDQGQHWADVNAFVVNSPFDSFVRACRTWAFDSGPGDKAVFATAYSYVVRQMKYSDTDHELAIAIARPKDEVDGRPGWNPPRGINTPTCS